MTITQIETNITKLLKDFSRDSFVFEFLLAYGVPKSSITRLKKSDLNQLDSKGEVTLRKKLLFKEAKGELYGVIDTLRENIATQKQKPRFIIVTDYETLVAYDSKTDDTLNIKIKELVRHYDFFLPLAGMEKSAYIDENPADVKASNRLAKLYDEILKSNPTKTHEEVHALNVFLTRLLFCYFAEDSNIFTENLFTNSISKHTQVDGSDLSSYLERLFELFNTDEKSRDEALPEYLKLFPYVNGGLFKEFYPVPKFITKSRDILIDIGKLDWSAINPDIFGSMIQAVVTPEHRGNMGMHYTSVPNIMKVIKPLFLDELYLELEKAKGNAKKLNLLHLRLQNLKIFDPACGSGNFLIIAYKELRKLEMLIFKEGGLLISPSIKLSQFYGIELDDFAHEVATLSLWLTEHQMNMIFKKEFGTVPPALPLHDGGNIICANATRIEWESVCPKEEGDEIYVLGNPPYLGARLQSKEQKEDMRFVFKDIKGVNNLDYIACWFYKGANYIKDFNAKFAFVSTNSITQGEQVAILWPLILDNNLEIFFAYQSFKWTNNAKGNAGVIVVIIGIRNVTDKPKYLYQSLLKQKVNNINAYLLSNNNIFIKRRIKPLSKIPEMVFGSMPNDGGCLILSEDEKKLLISKYPTVHLIIKKFMGSQEFIKGQTRYCLWINEETKDFAYAIPEIFKKIEECKIHRKNSSRKATQKLANIPYKFAEIRHQETNSLIIPSVSSDKRKYIPIGFLNEKTVISNLALAIYNAEIWVMGILTSYMHMCWVRMVSGRLGNGVRYSVTMSYNTFPFPNITQKQKDEITELVFDVLDEREKHSEKTLAQLYDPDKMPQGLKEAHHRLDLAIERCYRKKPFESDEERLEYLFKLYEEMIEEERK